MTDTKPIRRHRYHRHRFVIGRELDRPCISPRDCKSSRPTPSPPNAEAAAEEGSRRAALAGAQAIGPSRPGGRRSRTCRSRPALAPSRSPDADPSCRRNGPRADRFQAEGFMASSTRCCRPTVIIASKLVGGSP